MAQKNVIEINGKLYDARSGKPIDSLANQIKKPVAATLKNTSGGRSVDGFSQKLAKQPPEVKKPVAAHSHTVPQPLPKVTAMPTSHRTASAPHKASLKPKRSLTLNRHSVTTPSIATPTVARSDSKSKKTIESPALKHANPARFKRAQNAAQSPAISRFGDTPLGPDKKDPQKTRDDLSHTTLTLSERLISTHTPQKPTMHMSSTLSAKEALIKTAVSNATSASNHTKQPTKKRHRFSKYVPAALVFLVLSGYVTYLNVPDISMKVAAHRAGFAATMPGYQPAGYSLSGPIAANPGEVSVNFASNTDDRNFKLKQQPTTWDSTALLENLVVKKSPNYLTYQDRGLTIYIFDGSSAAWVNGGKLYQVEGNNSRLDTDQLLKIATSV